MASAEAPWTWACDQVYAAAGVGRETIKSRLRYATHKLRAALENWR